MYSGADPSLRMKLSQPVLVGRGGFLSDGAKRSDGSGAEGLLVVGKGCGRSILSS